MTTLFHRDGTTCTTPATAVKNGGAHTSVVHKCTRCGGAGRSSRWIHTGSTCFDCHGAGNRGMKTVRVFTAEKLAKLNDSKAARDAKKIADIRAKVAARRVQAKIERTKLFRDNEVLARAAWTKRHDNPFLKDIITKGLANGSLSERQIQAADESIVRMEDRIRRESTMTFVGKEGKRASATLEVVKIVSGGSHWRPWCLTILKDEVGNSLTTFGKCPVSTEDGAVACTFFVKEHKVRDDLPQTSINRIKVDA